MTTAVMAVSELAVGATPFDAVTCALTVPPTSACTSVYDDAVAPPIAEQFAPRLSHLNQAYVNVNDAGKPAQVPFVVVSFSPLAAVPDSDGAAVFCGEPVTTAVWFEVAAALPPPFVAVTFTRIVLPWSPVTGVYVDAVAPPMSEQFAPAASHCRHW